MSFCMRCLLRNGHRMARQLNSRSPVVRIFSPGLRTLCSEVKADDHDGRPGSVTSFTRRTHHCGELRRSDVGVSVTLCGWVQYQRMSGQFFTLRDSHGVTQVTLVKTQVQSDKDLRDIVSRVTPESLVEVTGLVKPRPSGQENQQMRTGDVEVIAREVKVLNPCTRKLPFHIQEFQTIKEPLRMEYRYLDLRNAEMQKNLRIRSKIIMKMREFLCNEHGFVDVETPTLFRRTPGGAREFVVPTHSPGKFFSLPQSPQQFKQLLMVGGIDRYMQIARCYRDEQAKPDRQPEFTQLDLEMSFVTQEEIKSLVESLLRHVWPDFLPTLELPIPRITYADAISEYGSDKPDTRFDWKLVDITNLLSGLQNPSLFWLAESVARYPTTSVQAINFTQAASNLSNKNMKDLGKVAKLYTQYMENKPWYAMIRIHADQEWHGTLAEHLGDDFKNVLNLHLDLNKGDLLMLSAGSHTPTCSLLGRLRSEVADMMEQAGVNVRGSKDKMNFLWVEDFPLFLPKEDRTGGLESAHHPFTAPHPDDEFLVQNQPEMARSQHYDLVLNGSEIGGGSIRIHQAELQEYILSHVLKEDSSAMSHLLEALQFGCPPHGGIALGLDRLFATLLGCSSIRDVIAFPKSSKGEDLMAKAPGPISSTDAEYYCIRTVHDNTD